MGPQESPPRPAPIQMPQESPPRHMLSLGLESAVLGQPSGPRFAEESTPSTCSVASTSHVLCTRKEAIVGQVPTPHRTGALLLAARAAPQGLEMAWAAAVVASTRRLIWRVFLAWRRQT